MCSVVITPFYGCVGVGAGFDFVLLILTLSLALSGARSCSAPGIPDHHTLHLKGKAAKY